MEKMGSRDPIYTLNITSNASGAAKGARRGDVIVIIDVIDMSTTAEAALDGGAIEVFGASSDNVTVPITINPEKIGYFAGKKALKNRAELIVIAEPRLGDNKQREENIQLALAGVTRSGAKIGDILPNIGREIVELVDFKDKVVLIVTASGGVAFDAAYSHGAPAVITGTIARTEKKKGFEPAQNSANRAIKLAKKYNTGITLVAASSNSYEDILASEAIGRLIAQSGFLNV
ncbi:hypothetical protein [Halonatronum saccharophilum]|uniref:hypothetical protein n=1 Tax=Halonatronum saccharophilum TaxID=150060 RepID=UPI0004BBFBAA|nr:hypothetical protein [Halonatronum saccharophilum]